MTLDRDWAMGLPALDSMGTTEIAGKRMCGRIVWVVDIRILYHGFYNEWFL